MSYECAQATCVIYLAFAYYLVDTFISSLIIIAKALCRAEYVKGRRRRYIIEHENDGGRMLYVVRLVCCTVCV